MAESEERGVRRLVQKVRTVKKKKIQKAKERKIWKTEEIEKLQKCGVDEVGRCQCLEEEDLNEDHEGEQMSTEEDFMYGK